MELLQQFQGKNQESNQSAIKFITCQRSERNEYNENFFNSVDMHYDADNFMVLQWINMEKR